MSTVHHFCSSRRGAAPTPASPVKHFLETSKVDASVVPHQYQSIREIGNIVGRLSTVQSAAISSTLDEFRDNSLLETM